MEQRVAKVSKGLIPPPFLITIQYVFELCPANIRAEDFKNLMIFKKSYKITSCVF
jgi:hypothetical protein